MIRRFLFVYTVLAAAGAAAGMAWSTASAEQPPRKLKVHISVDMEGIVGIVTSDQLGPTGFEYGRFREFMTKEALEAVQAAKVAGATEIVVADSHGNGENLLIEQFPPDVRIVRSWPRKLGMMAGIDETFDAAMFIGYHASTNNPAGVRAHTFSSATLTRVALNGTEVTEGAWNAAIAGHFGVPVILVSGDDVAVAEVKKLVGDIEGAVTKQALGYHAALTLTPQASYDEIRRKARAAFARRESMKPYTIKAPVTLDISFKHYTAAELLAYLPGVERVDSHSVRYVAKDMVQASTFMQFVTHYRPDITP
ncbi:MAG: M55 family metallopeptidase [Acidobacteriota bacterium]